MAMGFASAFGLAWLDERTQGRPVKLLIGDLRTGFANHSESDRSAAIRFIQRPDVSVLSWRPAAGSVHSKCYLVQPDPTAGIEGDVLVGSANLTRQGLYSNRETLSRAHPAEHERLRAELSDVMDQAWSAEDQILLRLGVTARQSEGDFARPASSPFRLTGRGRAFAKVAAVLACLLLALLVVIPQVIDQIVDSGRRSAESEPAADTPTVTPTVPPTLSAARDAAEAHEAGSAADDVESAQHEVDVRAADSTLEEQPFVELTAPPEDWEPEVDGIASTYGEPDRAGLQWVAWQPDCPSCEAGVTLTWVGSYAHPFNGSVTGAGGSTRPKLQSACLHRQRSGPLIDWNRNMSQDRVEAVWIDGESAPTGSWWIGGTDNAHTAPEPGPFLDVLRHAQQLRILTVDGLDATFDVSGFSTTPVQANLDHCGHYP